MQGISKSLESLQLPLKNNARYLHTPIHSALPVKNNARYLHTYTRSAAYAHIIFLLSANKASVQIKSLAVWHTPCDKEDLGLTV